MVLPGMSWPVVAIIIGIYEPIILVLNRLISLKLDKNDLVLLVTLGTSVLPSIFLTSYFLLKFLVDFKFAVYSIFVGLIVGSIYSIYLEIEEKNALNFIWFLAGLSMIVSSFNGRIGDIRFFQSDLGVKILDFLSGFIASTSLPAIGDVITFILLGNYEHLLLSVKTFDIVTLLIFLLGFLAGFWLFVKIVGTLLRKYRSQIFSFISGLMVSSIAFIWPFGEKEYSLTNIALFLAFFTIGSLVSIYFGIFLVRGKNGDRRKLQGGNVKDN